MPKPNPLRRRQVRAALLLDVLVADQMPEPPRSIELRSLAVDGILAGYTSVSRYALDLLTRLDNPLP